MTAFKKYKGYTLIELLVVLAIFAIIATIGVSAFYGLRDSISLSEELQTLSQELRYAQRSALFLERKPQERWLYGIGIDFSEVGNKNQYETFKWCSPYDEYGSAKTRGDFPNYDKSFPVGNQNGNFPVMNYVYKDCSVGVAVSELVSIPNHNKRVFDENFVVSFPEENNVVGDVGDVPVYVLFESVSGRAFFYDASGNIVNFNSEGKIVDNPIDLVFEIESPRTNRRKIVSVDNISGKVTVETEKM